MPGSVLATFPPVTPFMLPGYNHVRWILLFSHRGENEVVVGGGGKSFAGFDPRINAMPAQFSIVLVVSGSHNFSPHISGPNKFPRPPRHPLSHCRDPGEETEVGGRAGLCPAPSSLGPTTSCSQEGQMIILFPKGWRGSPGRRAFERW